MILYFGQKTEYKYGFCQDLGGFNFYFTIRNSDNINFIIYQNDTSKKIGPKEELIIESGAKITIYFSSPLTKLVEFFECSC